MKLKSSLQLLFGCNVIFYVSKHMLDWSWFKIRIIGTRFEKNAHAAENIIIDIYAAEY